nr:pilus assembly protein [Acidobacteriota bacterium]
MRILTSLRRHRRRPRSRGQSIVELALILPVLMLLVGSALDLGRMFYSQITIANAAREGAYEASYQPTSFKSNASCHAADNRIMCRVLSEAKGSFVSVNKADVSVACSNTCAKGIGSTVTVTVLGRFSLLTPLMAPFFGGSNVILTSTASAQIVTDPPEPVALPTLVPTAPPTVAPTVAPTALPTGGPTIAPIVAPTAPPVVCTAPDANFVVSPSGGFKNTTLFSFTDLSQWMPPGVCGTVWS